MSIAYQCDVDGFFIEPVNCQVDQLGSVAVGHTLYLVPKNATLIVPPAVQGYKIRRFINNEWIQVPDYRGVYAYLGDDRMLINTIGELPNGWGLEVTPEYLELEARNTFKLNRYNLLDMATITVNGNIYDANEVARSRMASAIEVALFVNSSIIPFWVMADNEVVENIPINEFRQAHAEVVMYMASIWLP